MINRTTRRFWAFWLLLLYPFSKSKKGKRVFWFGIAVLIIGFLLPQRIIIPVDGASVKDWNEKSFWAYPWGTSITHKGIDIFQQMGTNVVSATHGIVIYTHEGGKGGKSVMILGAKWRFHYYAHLNEIKVYPFKPVCMGEVVGTLGDSGNAKGKPPHLHYEIVSPLPYFSRYDSDGIQGWKKMFYLNPDEYLRTNQ